MNNMKRIMAYYDVIVRYEKTTGNREEMIFLQLVLESRGVFGGRSKGGHI